MGKHLFSEGDEGFLNSEGLVTFWGPNRMSSGLVSFAELIYYVIISVRGQSK